jgi:hypothetical protein
MALPVGINGRGQGLGVVPRGRPTSGINSQQDVGFFMQFAGCGDKNRRRDCIIV